MGDALLLRFRYTHQQYVEATVSDPDKCTILDIFVDLLEGAVKKGMHLPDHPSLWYAHQSQSFKLENDNDLMKMFTLFHGKEVINLAIGSTELPCLNLELARGLIEAKNPLGSDIEIALTSMQDNVTAPLSTNLWSHPSSRKIPATSARRKGLCIIGSTSTDFGNGSSTSAHFDDYTHDFDPFDDLHNDHAPFDDAHNAPTSFDDVHDNDTPSRDVQDDFVLPRVDDGFDPDACNAWRLDRDAYFDILYDNGELYEERDFGRIELREWMIFINKDHLMEVVRDYCVQEGFSVVVIKAEQKRYTAVCGDLNCAWRIHSARLSDGVTWAIKSLKGPHTCMKLNLHNSMATPKWVARKILKLVRISEELKGKDINRYLFRKFGINLKPTSLYKARKLALDMIRGDEDTSYENLHTYCEVLKTTNSESKAHCVWRVVENHLEKPIQFRSIFISLKLMSEGFIRGCRGLIGVDGCHLKGKYGGVLLSALALDGNNEIFLIGYGIYENESKDTWSSFFYHLRDLLKDANRDNWTIISDRQKGVEPALAEKWPTAARRYCCTHLSANFKKSYPGRAMYDYFWECCKAYSEFKFKNAMEKLQKTGGLGAVRWLQAVGDMACWARHKFDPSLHSPETTSNFVESFNALLGVDRELPVLSLLEGIRRTSMVRNCTRQQSAQSMPINGITVNARKILDKAIAKARNLEFFRASPSEYEIKEGNSYLPVNVENRMCACGQWQISGIPCQHAVRAILDMRGDPEKYVSHWYSLDMYRRTYSLNLRPVPDEEQWPMLNLQKMIPPNMKRGVGRPPRNRKRQEGQKEKGKRSRTVQCGKCKAFGHNSKTCKGGLTARELKEQQGIQIQKRQKETKKRKATVNGDQHQSTVVMVYAPWIPESQH